MALFASFVAQLMQERKPFKQTAAVIAIIWQIAPLVYRSLDSTY